MGMSRSKEDIVSTVQDQYAQVAKSSLSNDLEAVRQVASAFGYTAEDLASLPAEANMGLSCGNPVAVASLRPGEVVLDLGCGGGLDVLLAARQVGPSGKAIGVDMTADMLERARTGAQKAGVENVEFHQSTIDSLPLPDNSVDCIISNCVINLVPDKPQVFREMLRVLKPGGRVAISDIALKQQLPDSVRSSIEAYVGCIAGAILIDEYRAQLQKAGFDTVTVTDTGADLNAYAQAGLGGTSCCSTLSDTAAIQPLASSCCGSSPESLSSLHEQMTEVLATFDANAFAASVRVHAVKGTSIQTQREETKKMSTVQIYDKPMCCSTGVCGPEVDPVLPAFAADLDWLRSQGHQVDRFNLAQQPQEFVTNTEVQKLLASDGVECLPLVFIDGRLVSRGEYPSRQNLALWAGEKVKSSALPLAGSECCSGSKCC